ncbi:hypothetical protein GQ53DRAFT_740382 [Thozetella sp. PMI_491]|nr:hypothetical protein GQ53DRAFT_740382 [Thozetella sp. PMI_491]
MAPPDEVLLPKVFPIDLVSLGQLVRNPLVPNVDTYRGGSASVGPDDISTPDAEEPFSAIVSTDIKGRFNVGLTRYLGFKTSGKSTNLISIKAERLERCTLKDTGKVFRDICKSKNAQDWINDMILHKAPCYFVIGLQILRGAELKRAILKEGSVGGYATVPLEATQSLPIHVSGELSASGFGQSTGKSITGVFGIQVQRLDSRIAKAGEPRLGQEVSWKWTYQRVKGTQAHEEDRQLSLVLRSVQLDELVELLNKDEEDEDEDDI